MNGVHERARGAPFGTRERGSMRAVQEVAHRWEEGKERGEGDGRGEGEEGKEK